MRINPSMMAQIYWARMGRRGLREVDILIHQFESAPVTRDYWLVVKGFLDGCAVAAERKH